MGKDSFIYIFKLFYKTSEFADEVGMIVLDFFISFASNELLHAGWTALELCQF